jgi:glucose-1-phosphate adenylyltransferase
LKKNHHNQKETWLPWAFTSSIRTSSSKFLEDAHRRGLQDFGSHIIPEAIAKYKIYGYKYQGYWRDVGTIEAYWQANMDLVIDLPPFNLYDPETGVRTLSVDMPPVKLGPRAQISRSLVSNGCIINGNVFNSVLSPHVYVEEGAHVIDSIVFDDTAYSSRRRCPTLHH